MMNCITDKATNSIKRMPGREPCDEAGVLVDALMSADDRLNQTVSRTRRRVYSTVVDLEEQRKGRSKQSRSAMGMLVVVIAFLAPALWTSYLNFSEGAHFADFQAQIPLLAMMLFPGIAAVATASFMRHQKRS